MILLVLIAFLLIAAVTIYQYKEQSIDYHRERLERKESQVIAQIDYELRETTFEVKSDNLQYIFRNRIYEIADIQNLNFNIYGLDGELILSSKPKREENGTVIDAATLRELSLNPDHRIVVKRDIAGYDFQSSYVYINDLKFKPIGILNVPYYEDDSFNDYELREFLIRLGAVYFFLLLLAILLAYFISKYITRSLKAVSEKIEETRLTKTNEKIFLERPSEEIGTLVDAYNSMIDELQESAAKLAKSEREQAWREMAKQVAHEIKNPLTPMRLSVQSFERRFDPNDPDASKKLQEFSKTLIQQIDTMSNIASAFSSFAEMPRQRKELLNVVDVVKLSLDIFNEDYIEFRSEEKEVMAKLDRTQLVRVVTNLVKNAIQAMPDHVDPKIMVEVSSIDDQVKIAVSDNGKGIPEENHEKVFEPKFTTKSSGMGLGLGMVKNIVETYNGTISFSSEKNKGTVFTVLFPKEKS
ncbi:sensor histidine kinase [Zhouia amylolytica]|uniref:histidine kinase n=1 Tax=Zhouia amylolytica AD3 TaxID=1286632 RepID=W2ULM5_9FLAO|nr:ATP-binding protein [Zhouia amylolytica]ETN94227.1 integral membrane sensor signal transduction histidine kinase [Zhouia amylolytica AD3]